MSHTHTHTPSFLTPFPLTVNQTIQEEDIMNIVKMHQFYIFYFPRLERTEKIIIKFYTFLQCAHLCPCIMIFQKLANWRIYIRMYLLLPQSTCFKFTDSDNNPLISTSPNLNNSYYKWGEEGSKLDLHLSYSNFKIKFYIECYSILLTS